MILNLRFAWFCMAVLFISLNPVKSITSPQIDQTTTENQMESFQKPYIDGDHIINATRGKTISMKCVVHNLKNYKIAWYFNGILLALNNIRIKDDKRYMVENPTPHEWKLIIDPVDSINDGQYSCRLTNGLKKTIFLKVGVAPTFIGNNVSQVIINTTEKQNVTLSCEAEGNPAPSIYWYKGSRLVGTGPHFFKKDINRNSPLEYECVARNGIEPDPSRLFKINVNFKASLNLMYHLKEHSKKQNVKYSETSSDLNDGELQLVCEITGNPIHSIAWFKDGVKIKDDSSSKYLVHRSSYNFVGALPRSTHSNELKHKKKKLISVHTTQINNHKHISKLRIKNFDNTDNGVYKCSVNGFDGEVSKTITINEIVVKTLTENEIEYVFNPVDKNLRLNLNKNSKQFLNLQSENFSSKMAESNYLMHERARGARYNLTKTDETFFSIDQKNLAFKLNPNSILHWFILIVTILKLNSH